MNDTLKSNQQLKVKMPPNKGKQPQSLYAFRPIDARGYLRYRKIHQGEYMYMKNTYYWHKHIRHFTHDCPPRKLKELSDSNTLLLEKYTLLMLRRLRETMI